METGTRRGNTAWFAGRANSWLTRRLATHIWFAAAFGLVFLLSVYDARMAAAQSDPDSKLGEGVLEVLRAEGEASVVIMLEPPASMAEADTALAERKSDVASLQERVLSDLLASEFVLRRRYEAVPAVAGIITSEAGLEKLLAAPSVIRMTWMSAAAEVSRAPCRSSVPMSAMRLTTQAKASWSRSWIPASIPIMGTSPTTWSARNVSLISTARSTA